MMRLTRQVFDAEFDVGGRDAIWDVLQKEIEQQRRDAVREDRRNRYVDWPYIFLVSGIILAVCTVLYFCVYRSIMDGRQELADCTAGRMLPCMQAVSDAEGIAYDGKSRAPLYRAAYRAATGTGLPPLPKE